MVLDVVYDDDGCLLAAADNDESNGDIEFFAEYNATEIETIDVKDESLAEQLLLQGTPDQRFDGEEAALLVARYCRNRWRE